MTKNGAFVKAKQFLGAEVKDTITGFVGKCTGICVYDKAYDIVRCQVERVDDKGTLNSWWIDHTRLEIVTPAGE